MNSPTYFEIQSENPEATATFYTDLFGWKFTKQEGMPLAYWQIETDGIRGGLLGRPAPTPGTGSGTNAYTCSMEVDTFDLCADKIVTLGGMIALPKFAVPGKCWQGYFMDPAGNTFGIFEVDENAQ